MPPPDPWKQHQIPPATETAIAASFATRHACRNREMRYPHHAALPVVIPEVSQSGGATHLLCHKRHLRCLFGHPKQSLWAPTLPV